MTIRQRSGALRRTLTPRVLYLLCAASFGFVGALWATRQLAPGVSLNPLPSMVDCLRDDTARLGPGPSSLARIRDLSGLCWQQIQAQGTLNDFEIRRLAFFQQYFSNPVLLWMVVVVTLSGVVLAGIQLLASFELAAAQGTALVQDGELVIQKSRIALKSSVTGLFILVMSFAFFIVFVKFIYRIDQVDVDRPADAGPALPAGSLGPPGGEPATPKAMLPAGRAAGHHARHGSDAPRAAILQDGRRCGAEPGPAGARPC